jgi:hypothetical protein
MGYPPKPFSNPLLLIFVFVYPNAIVEQIPSFGNDEIARLQLVDLVSMVFCVNFLLIQGVPLSVVPAFFFSLLLDVSMASDFLL